MIKNKKIIIYSIFLSIFFYIASVSYLTPLLSDDFGYIGGGKTLLAWQESWEVYKLMYTLWSARIAHFIHGLSFYSLYRSPFEENFSQIILSIMNGMVFISFLLSLFFLLFARRPKLNDYQDHIRIILLFFLMMTILAKIGQTIFWLNGRIVYLWVIMITSWFFVFYRLQWADKNFLSFQKQSLKHILFLLFFLPLGFMAGMGSLIGNIFLIFLLAIGLGYKKFFTKQMIPVWCWLGFLCFTVGYIILLTAPGNIARMNSYVYFPYYQLPLLEKYFIYPLKGVYWFLVATKWLPLIAFFGLCYWFNNIKVEGRNIIAIFIKKIKKDNSFATACLLFLLTILFVVAMGISPVNVGRVWFFGTVMFLLCFMVMLDRFFLSKKPFGIFKKIYPMRPYIFIVASGIYMIYFIHIFSLTLGFQKEFQKRVVSITEQKLSGKQVIVVKKYSDKYVHNRFRSRLGGFWGHDQWLSETHLALRYMMVVVPRYYGVKKIIVE
ncbi:MAG: DUF6056 family protein [Alphaproteobacteria bacterium]